MRNNPDVPSFNETVRGEFAEQYLESLKKEMSSLIQQNTWKNVPHSEANNFIEYMGIQTQETT